MANVRKKQIDHAEGKVAQAIEVDGPSIQIDEEIAAKADAEAAAAAAAPAEVAEVAEAAEAEGAAEKAGAEAEVVEKPEVVADVAAQPSQPSSTASSTAGTTSTASTAAEGKRGLFKKKEQLDPLVEAQQNLERALKEQKDHQKSAEAKGRSVNRHTTMADAMDVRNATRNVKIETQRKKNDASFAKAVAFADAEDDELEQMHQADIEELAFEAEYEDELLESSAPAQAAPKIKGKFTVEANGISGDATSIRDLVNKHHEYADTKKMYGAKWRKSAMDRLHSLVNKYQEPLTRAISRDLGITEYEAYLTEIAPIHEQLGYLRSNAEKKLKIGRNVSALPNITDAPTKKYFQPAGTVCVINSWKSPVAVPIILLESILAGGNTAVIKNSARTKRCNEVIQAMFSELFEHEYVRFVYGGADLDMALLTAGFDQTVYVGPRENNNEVKRLTATQPYPTLTMLDGNNAVYVDTTADIADAATKIMGGKMIHAGQHRMCPDYVFVSEAVHKTFINRTYDFVQQTYGSDPLHQKAYPRMFSRKEFDDACNLLDSLGPKCKIVYGGKRDAKTLRIEPTVILCESLDHVILRKPICGPILVVVPFGSPDEAMNTINDLPTPPALYLFTTHRGTINYATNKVQYGQGCINNVMVQSFCAKAPLSNSGDAGTLITGGWSSVSQFGRWKIMYGSRKGSGIKSWLKMPFPTEGTGDLASKFKYKNAN